VDSNEIRELIELVSRSNFSCFELEREGLKLKLVKEAVAAPAVTTAPSPEPQSAQQTLAATAAAAAPTPARSAEADGLVEMESPIVGTFYSSPSPDAPPFVEIGSRIKTGQVICIVEAMKVMNEIESEIDAEVCEILVTNGQPVEFGEVLYRLRPLS